MNAKETRAEAEALATSKQIENERLARPPASVQAQLDTQQAKIEKFPAPSGN